VTVIVTIRCWLQEMKSIRALDQTTQRHTGRGPGAGWRGPSRRRPRGPPAASWCSARTVAATPARTGGSYQKRINDQSNSMRWSVFVSFEKYRNLYGFWWNVIDSNKWLANQSYKNVIKKRKIKPPPKWLCLCHNYLEPNCTPWDTADQRVRVNASC